jgi:hypothetical protein
MRGSTPVRYDLLVAGLVVIGVVCFGVLDPAFVAGVPTREILRNAAGIVALGALWALGEWVASRIGEQDRVTDDVVERSFHLTGLLVWSSLIVLAMWGVRTLCF